MAHIAALSVPARIVRPTLARHQDALTPVLHPAVAGRAIETAPICPLARSGIARFREGRPRPPGAMPV